MAKHTDFSRLCLSLYKGAKSSLIDQCPSEFLWHHGSASNSAGKDNEAMHQAHRRDRRTAFAIIIISLCKNTEF